MRDEHRHGMRDGEWGPQRPGRPEWGPGSGRGPGRRGGERGERGDRDDRGERGERGYGRHGSRSGGPFGPGFGPMGPGGPGAGLAAMFDRQAMFDRHAFGRGPRARKGDVRAAILDLLDEGGQWNGYQLIQEIAGRTSGVWRPSAGSVYPALQQLEDEGLIAPEGEGRRRMYALTEAGQAYAAEHADELRGSWDAVAGMTDDEAIELGDLIRQVMIAVMEVRRAGSPEQLSQARAVLAQTRRSMYRILAEDDPTADAATPTADAATPADTPEDGA
jgi:DNA-binding PadR family transcriptional regulator